VSAASQKRRLENARRARARRDAARKLYSLVLACAPRAFRRTYRSELLEVYDDVTTEAARAGGVYGFLRCWLTLCADALVTAAAERSEMIGRDLVHALRMLAKTPLFSAIVIGTLALAIGANASVYSVIDGVLLRPLPYPQANRLMSVYESAQVNGALCRWCPFSGPNLRDVRAQNRSFDDIAAYDVTSVTLAGVPHASQLDGLGIDDRFFATLGLEPELGRTIVAADLARHAAPVALLSDRVWRERYGADPSLVGRRLVLGDVPTTIVGIAPPGFEAPLTPFGTRATDIFIPVSTTGSWTDRDAHSYKVVGRLRLGTSQAAARDDLATIASRLQRAYPDVTSHRTFALRPLGDTLFGDVRPGLLVVFAGVVVLLLVACANASNLLLARAAARRGELTVRAALGASRRRLATQLFVETLVLAFAGAALGLGIAEVAVRAFIALRPPDLPRIDAIAIDGPVAAFAVLVALATTLFAGLAPALMLRELRLVDALREGGRGASERGGDRLRSAFAVAQVACAVALVLASGLVVESFVKLANQDPGFRGDGLVTGRVVLSARRYPSDDDRARYVRDVVAAFHAVPGVAGAGAAWLVPLSGNRTDSGFQIADRRVPDRDEPDANLNVVTPGFLRTLGVPLLHGRDITANDAMHAPLVVLVSRSFVDRYLAGRNPLRTRLITGLGLNATAEKLPRTIIGVVADVRSDGLALPAQPTIYLPYEQSPADRITLIVRSDVPAARLEPALERAWDGVDRAKAPTHWQTMASFIASETVRTRTTAALLGALAGLALLLAAAGLYGVMSYNVARQTHDIGVRMALGASPGAILRGVVLRGVTLAALGVAIGLAFAAATTRTLAGVLYGVAPNDPAIFALVAAILLAVAALAALVPALRATTVDPMTALRYE